MTATETQETPAGLRRFAKLTFASTLFLIFAGAMVTSTGSGLAVPDWPLAYGKLFPPMVGGIFFEHGHRLVASAVGLMTVILALWLQRREAKAFVRKLGWAAVIVVIIQGVLGGLTVILRLPRSVSIMHAAVAQIFLCVTAAIAFYTSKAHARIDREQGAAPLFPRLLVAAVYAQILLGAWMRHIGAGLAIPDFPLSYGRLIPEFETWQVIAAFSHRAGAAFVLVLVAAAIGRALRSRHALVRGSYVAVMIVTIAQISLGAMTIWSAKSPNITSLHVVTGALLLSTTLIYALAESSARIESTASSTAVRQSEITA